MFGVRITTVFLEHDLRLLSRIGSSSSKYPFCEYLAQNPPRDYKMVLFDRSHRTITQQDLLPELI